MSNNNFNNQIYENLNESCNTEDRNSKRHKIDSENCETKINNTNQFFTFFLIFDANHFAFNIWSCFTFYHLLPFCSVAKSWQRRIWPFFDESRYGKALAKSLLNEKPMVKRKSLRSKRMNKQEALQKVDSMQLDNKSSVVTSLSTHYLYYQKSLCLSRKLPIQSRLIALFSFTLVLKHLTLDRVSIKTKEHMGVKNMSLIAEYCPKLITLNILCGSIDASLHEPISRMKSLVQLSMMNFTWHRTSLTSFDFTSLPKLKHFCCDFEFEKLYMDEYVDVKTVVKARIKVHRNFKLHDSAAFSCLTHLTLTHAHYDRQYFNSVQLSDQLGGAFCPKNFPMLISLCLITAIGATLETMKKVALFKKLTHFTLVVRENNQNKEYDDHLKMYNDEYCQAFEGMKALTHLCIVNEGYFQNIFRLIDFSDIIFHLTSLKISAIDVVYDKTDESFILDRFFRGLKYQAKNLKEFEMNGCEMLSKLHSSFPLEFLPSFFATTPLKSVLYAQHFISNHHTWKDTDLETE
jgi:hypothetical protein